MQSEAAQKIYKQRAQIAEFPHAGIKERCGLRQFRCRGQERTGVEATWACLSYNLVRLFSIRRKIANPTVAAAQGTYVDLLSLRDKATSFWHASETPWSGPAKNADIPGIQRQVAFNASTTNTSFRCSCK
jgi:hypothetical protein